MIKRVLVALGILVAIIAIIFYYTLGGSQALEFSHATHPAFYIQGHYFEGKYNDPVLEGYFFEAREMAEADASGFLTIINYGMNAERPVIRQFIGSASLQKPAARGGTEIRKFPRHQVIFTKITAHNLVMPSPDEVLEAAREFVEEKGLVLDTISYDTYISERELKVSFVVKSQ